MQSHWQLLRAQSSHFSLLAFGNRLDFGPAQIVAIIQPAVELAILHNRINNLADTSSNTKDETFNLIKPSQEHQVQRPK